jgi:hypothetical protein
VQGSLVRPVERAAELGKLEHALRRLRAQHLDGGHIGMSGGHPDRVGHVQVDGILEVQRRRHAPLRPRRRAPPLRALVHDHDPELGGQVQGGEEPGRTGPHDKDVGSQRRHLSGP